MWLLSLPPRPLKRSASVSSLPTPPRTHHKRKRAGSKCSRSNDADLTAINDDPPVSPLPSHCGPVISAAATPVPRTPTPKSSSTWCNGGAPSISRDSPDNPFLASPLGSQDEVVVNSVPSSQEEKPTTTFVLAPLHSRGVHRTFPNPYYNASSSVPNPNSQLLPEHPDFEPDERSVKKLLFCVRPKNGMLQRSGSKNRRVAEGGMGRGRFPPRPRRRVPGSSDEEAEIVATRPMKLNLCLVYPSLSPSF
ncbi:hypothetical protein B0H13DRAFT_1874199 [Mycena leptocephala]|nr:hypothetical protein B0H13DRAFT_1874199 [Mycena leptocephala]